MTAGPPGALDRRGFLRLGAAGSAALLLSCTGDPGPPPSDSAFGAPKPDPGGLLDLPRGWSYTVLFDLDSKLSDGAPAPEQPDAMAAFEDRGMTVLVRNHELAGSEGTPVEGGGPFDRDAPGGTTALVVDADLRVVESYVTSSGSVDNCAGGPTPWGTWLTCEETLEDGHGYVFEVLPTEREHELSRTPIRDMGLFSHEAAGVDPETGIVYLTEDQGPVSFLYRFVPEDRSGTPGSLAAGGALEALALDEAGSAEAGELEPGTGFKERWVGVDPEDAHAGADEGGAVRFVRLEGAWFEDGVLWFNDTSGGDDKLGQTWRYTPSSESLELFFASGGAREMNHPDNAVIAPWGDFLFVEDASSGNRMMGLTPSGRVYELARNVLNSSELTGPCFSPDGATLFVSYQEPGITFAIRGPWRRVSAARRARMARAEPPPELAGHLTAEIRDVARRLGVTPMRAAAHQRLGAALLG